jgi:DNA modification methylase
MAGNTSCKGGGMSVQILKGDCRDILKTLPDESVHCVVTSPPYWGLRDYGVEGQLGMEKTYQEHVETIAQVFDEVKRILRKDGTLWLNYGDCYASSPNGRSAADVKALGNDDRTFRDKPFSTIQGVLKSKDLCGIPWRVAFALQDRGWYLRQDIIWAKPNPMPESIKDRCTKAHEYIFMMTKSPRYFYDASAIEEDAIYAGLTGQDESGYKDAKKFDGKHSNKQRGHGRRHAGFNDRWDAMSRKEQCSGKRNKRSVWTVATKPFSQAHFATFPPELIEPCILAGCPKDGTVLDPFGGAGTTGLVADRLGRNAILIELNPAYATMAIERINGDAPLFGEVAA